MDKSTRCFLKVTNFVIWFLLTPILIQDLSFVSYLGLLTITLSNALINFTKPGNIENKVFLTLALFLSCVSVERYDIGSYMTYDIYCSTFTLVASVLYCVSSEYNSVYVYRLLSVSITQTIYALLLSNQFRPYINVLVLLYFDVGEEYMEG